MNTTIFYTTEYKVLNKILDRSLVYDGELISVASQRWIADELDLSLRTVNLKVKALKEAEMILGVNKLGKTILNPELINLFNLDLDGEVSNHE